jgi:hypothetical protein
MVCSLDISKKSVRGLLVSTRHMTEGALDKSSKMLRTHLPNALESDSAVLPLLLQPPRDLNL